LRCQLAVGHFVANGDGEQRFPDFLLKIGALKAKWGGERVLGIAEVVFQVFGDSLA